MNPAGAAITILMAAVAFFGARRWAALAIMATICYVTLGQQIVVGGFHFMAIRIVLLAAFARTIVRRESKSWHFNNIDRVVFAYILALTVIPVVRTGSSEVLVYRVGCGYDIFLGYWVFRVLVRDLNEGKQFMRGLALLIVPMAMEMILETISGIDLFDFFGGVVDLTIRGGRPRCQGAFLHGITAGIFGATLMPIFVGLYRSRQGRFCSLIGLLSATVITYTSNSSAPLMAFLCGIAGWACWSWRGRMQMVRRGIVAALIGLQLCMAVPIWFIFSKLGGLMGGDGWHRSYLIERAIHFFPDWWLMGITDTGDWMMTKLDDGQADMTNQYLKAGVVAGLLGMILLVLILVRSFRNLGAAMAAVRGHFAEEEMFLWGMGCALLAHVVTLFSVTYFDQLNVVWWGFLAMIASAAADVSQQGASEETAIEEEAGIRLEAETVP